MKTKVIWPVVVACAALLAACGAGETQKLPSAQLQRPTVKGAPIAELRADTLGLADFKASFPIIGRPKQLDIARNFGPTQLQAYPHHEALVIRLPDGSTTGFPANDFYCVSFATTIEGNFEVITLRRLGTSTLAHFNSFDSKMHLIQATEIAREHAQDSEQSRKWGKFVDDLNYHYFYSTHSNGILKDSVEGTLVFLPSGTHKVLGEERIR